MLSRTSTSVLSAAARPCRCVLQAANQLLLFRSRLSPDSPPCTQLAACSCTLRGHAAGGGAAPRRSPLRWRGRGHSACRAPDRYQRPWAARGAVPPRPGAPCSGDGDGLLRRKRWLCAGGREHSRQAACPAPARLPRTQLRRSARHRLSVHHCATRCCLSDATALHAAAPPVTSPGRGIQRGLP